MTLRSDDLDAGVTADERARLANVAARIERERPVPAAVFRGDLRRRLERLTPSMPARRRRRLALGCLTVGVGMLAMAAVGLTGLGPLAPDGAADVVGWVISMT